MDYLLSYKVIYIFIITIGALIVGVLPIYSRFFRKGLKLATLGNCFSGGLFLAVAMADLVPSGMKKSEKAVGDSFQLSNIMVLVGYSLTLYVEKIMFDVGADDKHHHHTNDSKRSIQSAVSMPIVENEGKIYEDINAKGEIKTNISPLLNPEVKNTHINTKKQD